MSTNLKIHRIEFSKVAGTYTIQVTHVDPPLKMVDVAGDILSVERMAFRGNSPIIMVMPHLDDKDTSGRYFRIDIGKGSPFLMDKPPTLLNNPEAIKAVYNFCGTVKKLVEEPETRGTTHVVEGPALSL